MDFIDNTTLAYQFTFYNCKLLNFSLNSTTVTVYMIDIYIPWYYVLEKNKIKIIVQQ